MRLDLKSRLSLTLKVVHQQVDRHARHFTYGNLERGKRSIASANKIATDVPLPGKPQGPNFGDMDCGPTRCTYISCTLGPLKKKEYVVFRVRSRLWTSTVAKLAHHEYEISSR